MSKFQELGLNEVLLSAVTDMGFETPSEVQEKAIPVLLEEDTDLVALAQTGTGKTAAFGFPLIQRIEADSRTTQALILSPTRELCLQITNELKNYSKYVKGLNVVAIYGGASISEQAKQVKRGAQIVVATPGRMQDMINRSMVNINKIEYCVLDEADEMLNMGFYEDITSILSHTPDEKNTWLFSATMPKEVATIAKKFMHAPTEITVGTKNSGSANVRHEYYLVNGRDRYLALKRLADANPDIFSVVFCRTKRDTQNVAEKLIEDGYNAAALHGDLSQNQRDMVMKAFRTRQIQMLVATDVAARGIDVDDITHVINYQLPDEIETYNHRSGRTGRAGKSGISIVILPKSELRRIKSIERIIKKEFVAKSVPTGIEICEIQLYHLASKIKNTEINEEIDHYLPAINDVLRDLDREELIKKMVSVEFSRFFNYYKKAKDLNVASGRDREDRSGNIPDNGDVRYFINVGERDGYDWKTLKDFLKEVMELGRDDVYRVDVKESFSFFNTDAAHTEAILEMFKNFKLDGRYINVEISSNPGGGGRRRNRGDRNNRRGDRGFSFEGKRKGNKSKKEHRKGNSFGGSRKKSKRRS
ncbi:DEAD/DEAH box helicase [Leptobacterium flavescens]|uniref:DEAD/DEAH box helicase n=1 Tax=Leptobacterium flavescens TaxID=472055 RepID=A0A6P0UFD8_9FLAO|nr:DEAD/DEAH box helicase [Leptobacterium flavescens]NER11955.1 DEAD/DEAH box helicase [Leptobacterium flavescens]